MEGRVVRPYIPEKPPGGLGGDSPGVVENFYRVIVRDISLCRVLPVDFHDWLGVWLKQGGHISRMAAGLLHIGP